MGRKNSGTESFEKVRLSSDIYKSLFDRSSNGIALHEIITDKNGRPTDYRFIDTNKAFETYTGLIKEKIAGKTVREVIPGIENDKTDWIGKYGKVALQGIELNFESYSESLHKWYNIFAFSPAKNYFVTEFRDISSYKDKEAADELIKTERKRFYNLFEMMPVYMILLSADYHIPFANKFFRDRFGEPQNRCCYEYLFNNSEPCEGCESYKPITTNKPHEWEWTGPDGRNYYIYDYPFTDSDGAKMILEVGIDITELKQAQEALKKANESLEEKIANRTRELREKTEDLNLAQSVAHNGSWRLDLSDNTLIWSEEAYRIFEKPAGQSLTYELFLQSVHPEDREFVDQSWQDALTGKPYNIEHRILVNGKVKWVNEKAILEFNDKKELISAFGSVQEITEYKKLQEDLIVKNKELTRINELLEDFVFIAAHDLRSPVANLKVAGQMMDMIEDIDNKMTVFKNIMPVINRLERTVEGLVETINIQKGDTGIAKRLDLNKISQEIMNNLSNQIIRCDADIHFDFKEKNSIVYVEAYLDSILTNLIQNALKYSSESRKPVINVTTAASNHYCLLSVKDNGIGMNLETVGKDIFKPFKRFTDKDEGKGMGLYIIKQIIEKNGGFIKVESRPGEGTSFHCYLKEYL